MPEVRRPMRARIDGLARELGKEIVKSISIVVIDARSAIDSYHGPVAVLSFGKEEVEKRLRESFGDEKLIAKITAKAGEAACKTLAKENRIIELRDVSLEFGLRGYFVAGAQLAIADRLRRDPKRGERSFRMGDRGAQNE